MHPAFESAATKFDFMIYSKFAINVKAISIKIRPTKISRLNTR